MEPCKNSVKVRMRQLGSRRAGPSRLKARGTLSPGPVGGRHVLRIGARPLLCPGHTPLCFSLPAAPEGPLAEGLKLDPAPLSRGIGHL